VQASWPPNLQIFLRLLRIHLAVHEYEIVLLAEFFEHHVRRGVGVAWKVMKLVHGLLGFAVCSIRELEILEFDHNA
jgi:ATP-dependent Clp protease adapter protein ClpS